MEHKIIVVGIGPGNESYVLPTALDKIKQATVLVGGHRALLQFAAKGQKTCAVRGDLPQVMDFIAENLLQHDIVVMVSGDPGYHSLLDVLLKYFPTDAIEVIPGISAMQMAFAKLSMSWHKATLLSFHGCIPNPEALFYEPGKILGILTDKIYNSHTISACLLKNGWPAAAELYICSRLSYQDEDIISTCLSLAEQEDVYMECVLVVRG